MRPISFCEEKARARRSYLITVDPPLPDVVSGPDHRSADTLYNLDACGAGFQIRRNHMNGNRRYGCLLRAGQGVVEDNLFEDTTGAGLVLTNEPDWPEGPMPWDVVIRGNQFLRGGTCLGYADSRHGAALIVRATRLGHGLAEVEAIREVVIEQNEVRDRAGTAIYIGGASQVTLRGNTIATAPTGEPRQSGPAILIERSSGMALLENAVRDQRPGTIAAVQIAPTVADGEVGIRISDLDTALHPSAIPIQDLRKPRNASPW